MTGIPKTVFEERLKGVFEDCKRYFGIDPYQEPLKIQPGIHYFMGGLDVKRTHMTSLSGLYAAGECACIYHGANRLGGNSLLGALYGGRTAAESMLRETDMYPTGQEKEADGVLSLDAFERKLEVCPNYHAGADFGGAAAMIAAFKMLEQSERDVHFEEMVKAYRDYFWTDCDHSFACGKACPMKLPLDDLQARANRIVLKFKG